MRVLWALVKVVVGLAIAIPLAIILLATAIGVLGALVGLAVLALKLAVALLVVVGCVKLLRRLFGAPPKQRVPSSVAALPPADPYYEAALRELDMEFRGGASR
jgi:hypothetical protein